MITFKNDTELCLVTDFDEATDTITGEETETFKAGEPVDADIIDETEEKAEMFVSLQFGDGSVAFGVERECFTVVNAGTQRGRAADAPTTTETQSRPSLE